MFSKSLWQTFSAPTDFPKLENPIEVDVAIIGGGITGITTAQLLTEKGLSVCVLEARKVGGGSTSDSTGNLYATIDHGLRSIQSNYDDEAVQQVVTSRKKAVEFIENNVQNLQLDCDFKRVPMFIYGDNEHNDTKITDELKTLQTSQQHTMPPQEGEIPFRFTSALKMPNQAQFNPLLYVQKLAQSIESATCRIFENTRVTDIEEKEEGVFLKTTGGNVQAKNVVHATHTPKGVRLAYQTVLGPYREYGVAAKLGSVAVREGIFWGYFGKGDKFSVRTYSRGNGRFILAIGQPHKVGQAENNERNIQKLVSFLKEYFEIGEITHRWGGQHYRPADKLPYIGKKTKNSRIYLATSFSTDGLTYGTVAAQLISDEIAGIENPYAEFYRASRFTPSKSAKEFVKENLNVAEEMVKGLFLNENEEAIKKLRIGEGTVISKDGHKIAVRKNEVGSLQTFSAFCTHLKCVVHWNQAEKTWDCPCHGSRFDQEGCVLEGPALHPLPRIVMENDGDVESKKRE